MTGRGRAAALARLLLPAALVAAGCASSPPADLPEDGLLDAQRVVQELHPGAAAAAASEAMTASEGDAAADLAERELAAGNPGGALETVRRALLRLPPQAQAERLRTLRVRAKREFLRTAIARGESSSPARAAEGEPVPVKVSLRNLSPAALRAGEPREGASPTLVLLRVSRSAWDIFGNVRTETWEETHPLPMGEAGPGATLDAEIAIDTARFRETRPHGFVEYVFGGAVLPSSLTVGETTVHERIPVEESVTLAFPQRGWEEVAEDPGAHLERGIREGNPVRVLVAAACLPASERAGAAARLARGLRDGLGAGGATMESSVRASLRRLGGDREADRWTVEAWEARAFAPVVEGPGGER